MVLKGMVSFSLNPQHWKCRAYFKQHKFVLRKSFNVVFGFHDCLAKLLTRPWLAWPTFLNHSDWKKEEKKEPLDRDNPKTRDWNVVFCSVRKTVLAEKMFSLQHRCASQSLIVSSCENMLSQLSPWRKQLCPELSSAERAGESQPRSLCLRASWALPREDELEDWGPRINVDSSF